MVCYGWLAVGYGHWLITSVGPSTHKAAKRGDVAAVKTFLDKKKPLDGQALWGKLAPEVVELGSRTGVVVNMCRSMYKVHTCTANIHITFFHLLTFIHVNICGKAMESHCHQRETIFCILGHSLPVPLHHRSLQTRTTPTPFVYK